jgi:quinohemoprotein ethanol dehydrogenase
VRPQCRLWSGPRAETHHGVPAVDRGGVARNLGYVSKETIANLKEFVFNGPFVEQGMPDFTGRLKEEDIPKLQAFIQGTADAVRPKKN